MVLQKRVETSETRVELSNSLNRLIDVIDQQSSFANPSEPLSNPRAKEITNLIKKITKEIEDHYQKRG